MSLICETKGCKPFIKRSAKDTCGHKLSYRFVIRGYFFKENTGCVLYKDALERHNTAWVEKEKLVYEREHHPEREKEREEAAKKEPIPTLAAYVAPPREDFEGGAWWADYANAQYKTSENGRKFYYHRVKALLTFEPLADCRLDQIDRNLINRFRSHRVKVVCNNTTNQDVKVLGLVLRIAKEAGLISQLPELPNSKQLLPTEERGRAISKDEQNVYLQAITDRGFGDLRDLVLLALDAGCEPGKVVVSKLDWTHIHLQKTPKFRYGWLHDPFTKTKRRKRDLAIVTKRLHDALSERWLRVGCPKNGLVFRHPEHLQRAIAYNTLYHQHDRLWEGPQALQIEYFRPYDLRHTFSTRTGESGVDTRTHQVMMGWASPAMADRYQHGNLNRIALGGQQLHSYLVEHGFIEPDDTTLSTDEMLAQILSVLSGKTFQRSLKEDRVMDDKVDDAKNNGVSR